MQKLMHHNEKYFFELLYHNTPYLKTLEFHRLDLENDTVIFKIYEDR